MSSDRLTRNAWLLLLLIVLVAAFFRFYQLHLIPPGFQFDEAYNAKDATLVMSGDRPLFLPANGGREVLYTYLQAALMWALGSSVLALRFTSALVGLITVFLSYFMVKTLLEPANPLDRRRADAVAAALAAAAFLAVTYWHVHFSRYGIRAIMLPLLEVLLFYAFWRGIRTHGLIWWVLAGVLLGLGPYTHPAGRFLPLIITAFVFYKLLTDGHNGPSMLLQWLTMAAVSAVMFIPLGRYFLANPEAFTGHARLVSIFNPAVSSTPLVALGQNALAVLGMFFVRGDGAWNHNFSGRPVFGPAAAVCLVLGGIVALDQLGRRKRLSHEADPFVLLFIWIVVMLAPSLLSSGAPDFSRTIGVLPALVVLPALGLVALSQWLGARFRGLAVILVLGILGWTAYGTYADYFVRFPAAPGAYDVYDVDKIEAARYLRDWAGNSRVFLSPLWAEHATVSFLTRDSHLNSFDTGETLVIPSQDAGKDALYVFSWEQQSYIDAFAERMAPLVRRTDVKNSHGGPLMVVFRIPAEKLPESTRTLDGLYEQGFRMLPVHPLTADFGPNVSLLGCTLPDSVPAGEARPLALFWQAKNKIPADYTVFVHVLDARGRRWGQDDRRPNQGGYPTQTWEPGDLVIDQYWPAVDPCAPAGTVQLVAGLYEWQSQKRLAVTGSGLDTVPLGHLDITPPEKLTLRDRKPQRTLDQSFGVLRLLGADSLPQQVASGDVIPLNLFWQAQADPIADVTWGLSLRALDSGSSVRELWTGGAPTPTSRWSKDDSVCTHHDLVVPADTPSGSYEVTLNVSGSETVVPVGSIRVDKQPRSFILPDPQYEVEARLGETVHFLGYDIAQRRVHVGNALDLTTYWQAAGQVTADYTVFTHLLDAKDEVASQIDSAPAGGRRPTSGWLPGEVVSDTVQLPVPLGLKTGRYTVELGLYAPATGQRLPVFDEDGEQVAGDRVLLDTAIQVVP